MVWSSRSQSLSTLVSACARTPSLVVRDVIVAMVSARVQQTLVCPWSTFGWPECVSFVVSWRNIVKLRKSIVISITICTWRQRVMSSRTSASLWNTFISERLRRQERRCSTIRPKPAEIEWVWLLITSNLNSNNFSLHFRFVKHANVVRSASLTRNKNFFRRTPRRKRRRHQLQRSKFAHWEEKNFHFVWILWCKINLKEPWNYTRRN